MAAKKRGRWIQKATARMKKKGTLGKFGRATSKKIAAGKKKGGLAKKEARRLCREHAGHRGRKRKRSRKRTSRR